MGKFLAGLGVGTVVTAAIASYLWDENEKLNKAEWAVANTIIDIQQRIIEEYIKLDKKKGFKVL